MGAWGIEAFDNDTAADWAYGLEDVNDLSLVERALEAALVSDDLDADVGAEALAACEVLARLQGNWGQRDAYTEAVDAWVAKHPTRPSTALITKAQKAIDRVQSDDSELKELWDEGDQLAEWMASVAALRDRVSRGG